MRRNEKENELNGVKIAERREAEAKRQAERDRKRFMEADLIAKGAMVWVSALARREGPVIHVSAEEIEKARAGKYKCRMVADGSVDMVEEGYFEKFYE